MTWTPLIIDGGLDLITPPQAVKPGRALSCQNYEVARVRGMSRIDGYEKYDGGQSPSLSGNLFWELIGGANGNHVSATSVGTGLGINSIVDINGNNLGGGPYHGTIAVNLSTWDGSTTFWDCLFTTSGKPLPAATIGAFSVAPLSGIQAQEFELINSATFSGTISGYLTATGSNYTSIASSVQQVPGQGNVNGVFWLKDQLYATRDYLAANFTAGSIEPADGDTLFQGATFATATWVGQIAKHALTSGTWADVSVGNAAGTMMFYNTTGTLAAGAILNHTQGDASFATIGTFGYGNATATAAGLYLATGGRGSTAVGQSLANQSWQWCDLGWTIQYANGAVDFSDMNVALEVANAATNASNVVTTVWKTAQGGTLPNQPQYWNPSGGSWPGVVATQGDGQYAFTDVSTNGGIVYGGKSGIATLNTFGFTDADIPPTATIVGIQLQMQSGAIGITGSFTASYMDVSLNLIGLASGEKHDFGNGSAATYAPVPSAGATTPMPAQYNNFVFSTVTYGSQDANGNPNSMLGYTSITPTDIKSNGFGISYQVGPYPASAVFPQQIQFGLDYVAMRVAFLPATNMIYFWDSQAQRSVTDGAMTVNTNVLTSVTAAFTSADVGKTVIVAGAGSQITFNDGAMDGSTVAITSLSTVINLQTYIGQPISIQGQGSIVVNLAGGAGGGTISNGSKTLTVGTANTFNATNVGQSITVAGAGPGAATLVTIITSLGPSTNGTKVILRDAASTAAATTAVQTRGALLTTTLAGANPNQLALASAGANLVLGGLSVTIGGGLSGTIKTINSGTSVNLSVNATRTVSAATVSFYQPIQAQVVQHYQQSGDLTRSTAKGVVYFHFIQPDGTVGGVPARRIGSGEQIRTYPTGGQAPDGGIADLSLRLANASSAAAENIMDWSALMQGSVQPDGSFSPPSKYQSITQNFYASTGLEAIFGVSGAGPAFYYDGFKHSINGKVVPGNFARILTGLPIQFEAPRSICAHQGHLALGYFSGTAQWSNAQNVLDFNPLHLDKTANNVGLGQPVTCISSANGDALIIGCRQVVYMIQGNLNSPTTVYQSTVSPTSGMIEYSLQPMANYMYADFRGLTMVGATQKYGDFEIGHISSMVSPYVIPRVQTSAFLETGNFGFMNSYLCRNKNQYRMSFADGQQLTATFLADGEPPQFTVQKMFHSDGTTALTMDVVQAFTERLGRDRIFFATADFTGYVYEQDRGTSFNGGAIPAWVVLVADVAESPFQNKDWGGINIYGLGTDYASFNISRAGNYDSPVQATGQNQISCTFGSSTAPYTGLQRPFIGIPSSPLQIESTALTLRFDSNSGTQQLGHVIQAIAYDITPLNTVNQ